MTASGAPRYRAPSPKEDARQLARTPVANPYRGELKDPYSTRPVAARAHTSTAAPAASSAAAAVGTGRRSGSPQPALADSPIPSRSLQVRAAGLSAAAAAAIPDYAVRRPLPRAALWAGIVGLVLGVLVGIFGLLVIALIGLLHSSGDFGDRSAYAGADAAYVMLGVLDFGVSALLLIGSIALISGKLAGRLLLTVGLWSSILFAVYWAKQSQIPVPIPVSLGLAAAVSLVLSYQASVTRWLGVLPAVQPE
ncbi:hypothetical protein M6D93_18920 [Jatrophihabitans telluris]|uniref:Integral membrane protein n=1 Tax=Jatrophihabitans telluris TaxID=2038343 RepID=A0ABY4QXC0_9ACTN|nr:hypothetical protein [Jatrophihabitans telluris]UQX88331.1 hypothetical protein M6D93_18920 [Jatrophihabitans telluris]